MEFFERILALREKKSATQKAVAEAIGVTVRQYQRFEKGEQKPGFDNLVALADYFEVSIDYLTGRSNQSGDM